MGAQAVRLSNIDIDNALGNKDFEVLFQPIFDLGNGALARMETFVRWRHPDLGVLPPGAFISFFESQGRMSELTRYVLAEALTGYMQWRGPFAPGFSINLALTDLGDEAFAGHFSKLMRDREFPPDLVTLECPMPAVDADLKQAAASFARLRKTGARLAIEVRGRANDFLRSIDPFPFDEIKTGGSSILRFARTVRGPGLSAISDLLDIANNANAAITAVGVEDQASLAALRGLGFTAAQGNHLAKVGNLKEFLPSRVNEVRQLLGLSPLSADDLASLFRTSAPEPKAADGSPAGQVEANGEAAASAPHAEEAAEAEAQEPSGASESRGKPEGPVVDEEAAKRARARERAKSLALAKRAKARQARKAAAIRRAKAKAAQEKEALVTQQAAADQAPATSAVEPRDLQERLAKEFSGEVGASEDKASERPPAATSIEPARAPAGNPDAKQPEPAVQDGRHAVEQAAATEPPFEAVRLGGGAARAYFQPGVRIGGPALSPDVNTNATRRAAAASASKPAAAAPQPAALAQSAQARQPREKAPRTEPRPPGKAREPDQINVRSRLLEDDEAAEIRSPRGRRRKSFLKRTIIPFPKHFWPKSWKRRLRRLKASRRSKAAE